MTFGNPHSDHVTFRMKGTSRREQVMQMEAFVNAGFFSANLPIFVTRVQAEGFIQELEKMSRSLRGSAALRPSGQGSLDFLLKISRNGGVALIGDAEIDQNRLRFQVDADQTFLEPLGEFFSRGISRI